jgi:hypothetical protein
LEEKAIGGLEMDFDTVIEFLEKKARSWHGNAQGKAALKILKTTRHMYENDIAFALAFEKFFEQASTGALQENWTSLRVDYLQWNVPKEAQVFLFLQRMIAEEVLQSVDDVLENLDQVLDWEKRYATKLSGNLFVTLNWLQTFKSKVPRLFDVIKPWFMEHKVDIVDGHAKMFMNLNDLENDETRLLQYIQERKKSGMCWLYSTLPSGRYIDDMMSF